MKKLSYLLLIFAIFAVGQNNQNYHELEMAESLFGNGQTNKVFIQNTTLIDGTGAPPQANTSIFIVNNRIVNIKPANQAA